MNIDQFPKLSIRNREALHNSTEDVCSCYWCLKYFFLEDITEWCDDDQTALCPHCGYDTIVPGHILYDELELAKARWFTGSDESPSSRAIKDEILNKDVQ